jgi:hypothetical protein
LASRTCAPPDSLRGWLAMLIFMADALTYLFGLIVRHFKKKRPVG